VLEGKAAAPQLAAGAKDEFVELDAAGNPMQKEAVRDRDDRRRPGGPRRDRDKPAARKPTGQRRTGPVKKEESKPEEAPAAE
jgi:small subunit ribosomal protein S2